MSTLPRFTHLLLDDDGDHAALSQTVLLGVHSAPTFADTDDRRGGTNILIGVGAPGESASNAAQTPDTASIGLDGVNTAPTFHKSGDGIVTTSFALGPYGGARAEDVALQADGKMVLAGHTGAYEFAFARYNADGSLDTSFDHDGKLTMSLGGDFESARTIAIQPDGRIVVSGFSVAEDPDFAVVRFNADGSLDPSFDGDGKVTTDFGGGDDGYAVALQSDGKILVGGSAGPSFPIALARYNTDGSLDTTFDTDGKVTTDFGGAGAEFADSIAYLSSGKILLAGTTGGNFLVARYNADGSLDTTFGPDGHVTTDMGDFHDLVRQIVVQPDGKFLLIGDTEGIASPIAVARYNADGSLDTSFDGDGKVTTFVPTRDYGYDAALQSDGKLVVTGNTHIPTGALSDEFLTLRYNADGSLDTTFSGDGIVTGPASFVEDQGRGLALQSDGRIVVAGFSGVDFALVRYNADGSLDLTLDGVDTLNGAPTYVEGGAPVVLDSDAQVLDAELAASGSYAGASLTLERHAGASGDDVYSATGALGALTQGAALVYSGVTVGTVTTNSGGTLVLTFNGNATQARVDGVLQAVAYSNSSANPPGSVQIDWIFSDGNTGAQGTGGPLAAMGSKGVTIIGIELWSELVNGQVISPFDPDTHLLRFDDASISAADVRVTPGSTMLTYGGKTVTLGMDLAAVTTANIVFDNGSRLLVGDDITATAGDNVANTLSGGSGDDQLIGLGGNDVLGGLAGADSFTGEAGADRLDGGSGHDFARYDTAPIGVVANLDAPYQNTGEAAGDTYISIEALAGSAFADTLLGDEAGNSLGGLGGNDRLQGRTGNDALNGGDGNDELEGGPGADNIAGSAGFDYAKYKYAAAAVIVDLADPSLNTGEAAGDRYHLVEGLVGSRFDDRLSGNQLVNDLAALDGHDMLFGRGGNDNLQGMNGDDTMDGGAGSDRLDGGGGNDTFRFTRGEAAGDILMDFAGNGVLPGDRLVFSGYGTALQGATFTQVDATHWRINSSDGVVHEVVTLLNGALVNVTDYAFL